ncbi:MAG: hypothetical protein QOE36_3261 [Gaiellaceae bacterium]|nr:hypothetical protein [Gaiellaceae bacterium]
MDGRLRGTQAGREQPLTEVDRARRLTEPPERLDVVVLGREAPDLVNCCLDVVAAESNARDDRERARGPEVETEAVVEDAGEPVSDWKERGRILRELADLLRNLRQASQYSSATVSTSSRIASPSSSSSRVMLSGGQTMTTFQCVIR